MPHLTANFGDWSPHEPRFLRWRAWSALSGMVQRIPRRRSQARLFREAYVLSARTRLGRVHGLPDPRHGTRTLFRTGSNCDGTP